MSSVTRVPETTSMSGEELTADDAWRTIRTRGATIWVEAFARFRYGDGFSHARALGLQLCLAFIPLVIATVGLSGTLVTQRIGRVLRLTLLALPLAILLLLGSITAMLRWAPRRRQPGWSWLGLGAGVALLLWLVFTGLLVAYVAVSDSFGAVYGPLTGVIALLLWAQLTSVAIFFGMALSAQLEAARVGVDHGAVADRATTGPTTTPTSRS